MIEIKALSKSFSGFQALDIPSLEISEGITGLVGNNGAGKTTMFRLILDLLRADAGQVLIDGIPVAEHQDWKPRTGAFIDSGFLIDYLTPEEYFLFVGRMYGLTGAVTSSQLERYKAFMGDEILGKKRKYIRDLSMGNRQKTGIVGALLSDPDLLILDEPFNFLDPTSQSMMRNMLKDFQRRTRATVLISSHNLQHTVEISDRIILLEKGRIREDLENAGQEAREQLEAYFEAPRS